MSTLSRQPVNSESPVPMYNLSKDNYMPVAYQLRYSILKKIRAGEEVLPEIQGREETKKDVIRALLSGAHPYLVSEEGTGKTRLARSLVKLLPPILKIKGCPYNDDPRWHPDFLCTRCRESKDPAKEYGVEFLPGEKRFSRIQGNEYTNETKLLGLKDIQAIAQGKSPTDPTVFTGTGVFRANRGMLFVDELPAIRTNVQVLFHPILEEKKVILEEYNWQHPLDILLIATGNPKGFSHVYEVPRPLLDRLELIYMDLPEEEVEREIMLREKFKVESGYYASPLETPEPVISHLDFEKEIERTVVAPWWIIDLINRTSRYSRICTKLEKTTSIRAGNKSLDHTYASVEIENRRVAGLRDAYLGLRLALRGRIGLSQEYLDIEEPKKSFRRTDRLVEDMLWNTLEDFASEILDQWDKAKLAEEIASILSTDKENMLYQLKECEELHKIVEWMKNVAAEKVDKSLLNETERELLHNTDRVERKTVEEYELSALDTVFNMALHKRVINEVPDQVFVPQKITEWRAW